MVGQFPAANGNYFYYVLCVIDLEQQLGGRVSNIISGSVRLELDHSWGYTGDGWDAGFITADVSNQSIQQQVAAIRGMSSTHEHELNPITLNIAIGSIVNNKIIVGVKRPGTRVGLGSYSADINANVNVKAALNVTYNIGSGSIVAYIGSYHAPTAPALVKGYETDQVHIAPLTASIPDYQLVYNENLAPLNPSEWWIRNESFDFTGQALTPATNSFPLLKSQDNYTFEAQMKKLCNLSFQNYFPGVTNPGVIKFENIQYNAPKTSQVVEGNSLKVEAVGGQDFNTYILYFFKQWGDGSTINPRTFIPSSHAQHTITYYGKPVFPDSIRNLTYSTDAFNHIVLSWNEHPNQYVTQYQIWRRVKHNGSWSSPQYLATRSRGNRSYTDKDYTRVPNNTGDEIWYDVRPYFSLDNTWGNEQWGIAVFGSYDGGNQNSKKSVHNDENETITDYAISSFPNPFNPTAKLEFQLPKDGFVKIKIYNSAGQEIAELLNDFKAAGKYLMEFDGSSLSSGIYYCELTVRDVRLVKKMMLIK